MFDSLFPKEWTTLQRLMWLKTNALARAVYEIVTGNPVSFTAKAAPLKQLSVAFSPKQDLHGYDSPWPAGGGKNKTAYTTPYVGVVDTAEQAVLFSLSLKAGTYTFSCKQSVEIPTSIRNCLMYSVNDGVSWSYENASQNFNPTNLRHQFTFTLAEDTTVKFGIWSRNPSVSATFTEWQVEAGSSFTSYAPYSNLCPILGWDSLNVWQSAGARITIPTPTDGTYNGVAVKTNPDGSVSFTGTCTASVTCDFFRASALPTGMVAGKTYKVALNGEINTYQIYTSYGAQVTELVSITSGTATFTIGNPVHGMIIRVLLQGGVTYNTTIRPSIVEGETLRTISITLGSTVYSGTVDVVTGVVTVTRKGVDMGSLEWSKTTLNTSTAFYYTPTDAKAFGNSVVSTLLAECYKTVSADTLYSNKNATGIISINSHKDVQIRDTRAGTRQELAGLLTGVLLVYELATPQSIQLTPQEVESLLGENNMWSNANQPITVEYRKN